MVLKLKQHYKEIVILSGTGEHDLLRGTSVIEHLESLGVKVVKGDYIEDNVLFGHFMLYESKLEYGTGKCGIKDLTKYQFVFLGHQHNPQDISKNIFHIGSIRFVNFNEVNDTKRVALLKDNNLSFIPLKSCIPMIDITDINKLTEISPRTKVRYVSNSFEDYRKNASFLNKVGKKFFQFKIKLAFKNETIKDLIVSKSDTIKTINKEEIIKDYLEKIEDKAVQQLLTKIIYENN